MHAESFAEQIPGISGKTVDVAPRVVVLYEDISSGIYAFNFLGNVFKHLNLQNLIFPALWRFDIVDDPAWFNLAQIDAANADVLVVSTNTKRDLKPSVGKLVESCLERTQEKKAAIVTFLGPVDGSDYPKSARLEALRDKAKTAGFDFICDTDREVQ